ncbi:UNVERIFIED_CONTAM: hypothetical protein FKN15_032635 [Acipenser sinensis]
METDCGALPAHYAAAKGDLTCLKLLVSHEPGCVNWQMRNGATPLYLPSQEGHLHSVEFLVKDCGASLLLWAQEGTTALHAAAHMGHYTLESPTSPSWQDLEMIPNRLEHAFFKEEKRLFHRHDPLSAGQRESHCIALCCQQGHHKPQCAGDAPGSKAIKDHWGGTPLHDAAENGELEVRMNGIAARLGMSQVDPRFQDRDGYTAGDLAAYNRHYDCARFLKAVQESHTWPQRPPPPLKTQQSRTKSRAGKGGFTGPMAGHAVSTPAGSGTADSMLVQSCSYYRAK